MLAGGRLSLGSQKVAHLLAHQGQSMVLVKEDKDRCRSRAQAKIKRRKTEER
jgi:Trk K+ transport system NAD-binding subunit